MSAHGTVNGVQGHATFWMVRGERITFNYAEPHLRHNKAKYWVDAHNNRRHDPIDKGKVMTKFTIFFFLKSIGSECECQPCTCKRCSTGATVGILTKICICTDEKHSQWGRYSFG